MINFNLFLRFNIFNRSFYIDYTTYVFLDYFGDKYEKGINCKKRSKICM